jgi:SAM-dependent methyltransferase
MPDERLFPATLMPDSDWWHVLWPDPERVLRAVGMQPGMRVVDLCCGDGHFTRPMCDLVSPGETWALDLDKGLLGQAEAACSDCPNFHAIHGDARELPARIDRAVDFVFIANTFHGVPDKVGLARAVHQVLQADGLFAIVNWHRRPREETTVLGRPRGPDTELRMRPEAVRRFVEPAGFELTDLVEVGPYHYAAVFAKGS